MRKLVCFHDDMDGYLSAVLWNIKERTRSTIYASVQYGQENLQAYENYDDVVFLDFNPSKEAVECLCERGIKVTIYDHHAGSEEKYKDIPKDNLQVVKSDGTATCEFLLTLLEEGHSPVTRDFSEIVRLIGGYDVGRNFSIETPATAKVLMSVYHDILYPSLRKSLSVGWHSYERIKEVRNYLQYLDYEDLFYQKSESVLQMKREIIQLKTMGEHVDVKYQGNSHREIQVVETKNGMPIVFLDLTNRPHLNYSEAATYIARVYNKACVVRTLTPHKFSVRSLPEMKHSALDVVKDIKSYTHCNGGGHEHAASVVCARELQDIFQPARGG